MFVSGNPSGLLGGSICSPRCIEEIIKKLSETFNIQFRAESFNIINHTNFRTPVDNTQIFDNAGAPTSGGDAIDSWATSNRQIRY